MLPVKKILHKSPLNALTREFFSLFGKKKKVIKPFSAIPGPKPYPVLKNMWNYLPRIGQFDASDLDTYHKLQATYGDMVKIEMPSFNIVYLFDPELIKEAFHQTGPIPRRPGLEALARHRSSQSDVYANNGLLVENGAIWKTLRLKVQRHYLNIPAVQKYSGPMSKVTVDFVERMKRHRKPNNEIDDFRNEVMKWALESVGVISVSRRLGCLSDGLSKDSESQKVIDSVLSTFDALHQLEMSAGLWKLFPTTSYRQLVKAQTYFESVVLRHLNEAAANILSGSPDSSNILGSLLLDNDMDLKKISGVMIDTFLAGVDTTSAAALFVLYELAINPDKQEKVFQEVSKFVSKKDEVITGEQLNKLKYLNACIKESMRLHPPTVGTGRVVNREFELGGYHIPVDTRLAQIMYVSGKNEKYFPESAKFVPERWINQPVNALPLNYAYAPFGIGLRACVGMVIAQQEIRILVSKVLQSFRLEYQGQPIGQRFGIVLIPDRPFAIKFHDRNPTLLL